MTTDQDFNIADLNFLTEGSVFTREDGRMARFLFLTNQSLSEKMKQKFPPQVVYADENDNILSCDIDRFLAKRKFVNVIPELEERLLNLLAATSSESEETLDLDSDDDQLIIEDTESSESQEGDQPAGDDFIDSDEKPVVTLLASRDDLPVVINVDQFTQAVSSYQQNPGVEPGTLQHTLFIREEPGISSETIYAAFSPTHADKNVTYEFQVEYEGEKRTVEWDTFAGIYPAIFFGSRMFQVIFYGPRVPAASLVAAEELAQENTEVITAAPDVEIQQGQLVAINEAGQAVPAQAISNPAAQPVQVQVQPVAQVQVQVQAAQ